MAEAKGGRSLVLDAITHRYPGGAIAVENINLDVKGGEIIALLGPSGCGKTTLLRIVAGFIAQTQGRIIIGDEIVDMLPPNKRAVGIVFQNYALFPHLTIAENVAYGLAARGVDTRDTPARSAAPARARPASLDGRTFAAPALRRPAAARRAGPRAGDQAVDPAARRALCGARQEPAARHADRGQAPAARFRHYDAALSRTTRKKRCRWPTASPFSARAGSNSSDRRPTSTTVRKPCSSTRSSARPIACRARWCRPIRPARKFASTPGPRSSRRPATKSMAEGGRVTVCIRPEHLQFVTDDSGFAGVVGMALPLGATVVHEVTTADGSGVKISQARFGDTRLLESGVAVRVAPLAPCPRHRISRITLSIGVRIQRE